MQVWRRVLGLNHEKIWRRDHTGTLAKWYTQIERLTLRLLGHVELLRLDGRDLEGPRRRQVDDDGGAAGTAGSSARPAPAPTAAAGRRYSLHRSCCWWDTETRPLSPAHRLALPRRLGSAAARRTRRSRPAIGPSEPPFIGPSGPRPPPTPPENGCFSWWSI